MQDRFLPISELLYFTVGLLPDLGYRVTSYLTHVRVSIAHRIVLTVRDARCSCTETFQAIDPVYRDSDDSEISSYHCLAQFPDHGGRNYHIHHLAQA